MKALLTRGFATAMLCVSLVVGVPAAAYAGGGSRAGQSSSSSLNETYAQELLAYSQAIKAINRTFREAVNAAQGAFSAAISVALDSGEKVTARAEFRLALAQATSNREAALKALGNPPTKP